MLEKIGAGFSFYLKARTKFKVQSPKAYDFILHVLDESKFFYAFHWIEVHREQLMRRTDSILIEDLGAGSRKMDASERRVGDIAKYSLSSVKQSQRLFRLVEHYQPKRILELGTSLGISAAYMAMAHSKARLITIEGDPNVAKIAEDSFERLATKNIRLLQGSFKEKMPLALELLEEVDLAFIDGHHTYEATVSYTQQILPFLSGGGILVFDDINWSRGMRMAWEEVKQLPGVTMSIDLFDQGFLFFDSSILYKQDINYIKYMYKPWQLGLFQ